MNRSIKQLDLKRPSSVSLWTPWGTQTVPRQEVKVSSIKRLAGRLSRMPKPRDGMAMQA